MSLRVLLVDDEPTLRWVARVSLAELGGWQVLEASSGHEALEVAAREAPDVILLDVMMPGLDGPSTLAQLRANEATASIPVIFLTAKALESERERGALREALGVIAKPFDAMQLPAQVRALLERSAPL